MSEMQQGYGTRSEPPRAAMLTPEASAITAFTLAVLAMTGQGVWTQLAQVFFGTSFRENQFTSVLTVAAFASLVMAAAAVLLGRRAMSAPQTEAAWSGHLARAAVLLGLVAGVVSLLTLVVGLLQGV